MNENEYVTYLRAMLYLFSVYNVASVGIVHWKSQKRLFWIHMTLACLLLLNFLGIMLIKILGMQFFDAIIFDYGMTFVLIVFNVLVWGRLYSRDKVGDVKESSKKLIEELHIDNIDNSTSLFDIVNRV